MADNDRSSLNEAQARHVLATFRHIDDLMMRALRPLAVTGDMLTGERGDFDPEEAREFTAAIDELHRRMELAAAALGLKSEIQPVTGHWAAKAALRLAGIALSELEPKRMQAYGEIRAEAAQKLKQQIELLQQALRDTEQTLQQY